MKDLFLVVDMQNVYLPGQPWGCERAAKAAACIREQLDDFSKEQIIFTRHLPFSEPQGVWAEYNFINADIHCNPWMSDFMEPLKPCLGRGSVYTKSTYSCCKNPKLRSRIASCERVFIAGVMAEYCILSTVFDLIDMGKKVIYLRKCIAGKTPEKEDMVVHLLKGLSPLHILLT